jgi:hypothetical protein
MKVNKGVAFIVGILAVVGLAVFSVLLVPETVPAVIPGAVLGIVGVTTAYIGGNVADNGVKGKYYNPALDPKAPVGSGTIVLSSEGGGHDTIRDL